MGRRKGRAVPRPLLIGVGTGGVAVETKGRDRYIKAGGGSKKLSDKKGSIHLASRASG